MKTFKQFQEETQKLDEALPLLAAIPAALKIGGAALTAYSAGSALNNLRKGKFKQAAFDAIGAIPGGKVFKGIRALGGAKNLAKAGSFVQSASRLNATGLTPNAYAKGVDKTFDIATKGVQKGFSTIKGNSTSKNNNKNNNKSSNKNKTTPDTYSVYNPKVAYDTGKKYKQTIGKAAKGGVKSSKA